MKQEEEYKRSNVEEGVSGYSDEGIVRVKNESENSSTPERTNVARIGKSGK